ncbi:MAG: DUF58 domain-containing protein [Phycisphaerae bacterium]|nr:DUF58 domain-containing protein [Phycisphaerae bacterium]
MPAKPSQSSPSVPSGGPGAGLSSKYLRLDELRWLRNLFFASRHIVEGQYAGRHSSARRGHSVEFSDYRQYMPGDEPTDIDWKVYARSDRLFVKLFEQQSDMVVNVLVDASASMGYAGQDDRGYSKFDHACMMATAIAFLTVKQQDKVSFAVARDGAQSFLRPYGSFKHFTDVLRTMERTRPSGEARLPEALRTLAGLIGRRGLLVVFTDLLEDLSATFDALSIFTHRGGEVIVFQVLHADELHLPRLNNALFVDSETRDRVGLNVEDVRAEYERTLREFLERCSAGCKGRGMDYNLVPTDQPYTQALRDYLFRRASIA